MAQDVLTQRTESAQRRLEALRRLGQGSPEQEALLAPAIQDLSSVLDEIRALRGEMRQQEDRERLLVQATEDRRLVEDLIHTVEWKRRLLQAIMDNTPAQLAYLDPEFNFVRVNAAYAEGSGYSREELIGRYHFDLFPDAENQAIFESVRDSGQPVSYQARPFEYAGQPERGVAYCDWTLAPVHDEAGGVQGLVLSLAEVTEREQARHERERLLAEAREQRQKAEEASRGSEAANRLLRALIETMPIGVIVSNGDGTLVMTNASAQAIPGSPLIGTVTHPERAYTPHRPDGSPFPPQDLPLVHALNEGKVVRDVEILIRRSDGSERILSASAAPVTDEAGEIVSAVTVFRDTTELKQAQETLQRYTERLQILHETDQAILAARSVEEIAEAALSHVQQLVPCQRASLSLFDLEKNEAFLIAARAEGETQLRKGWHGPLGSEWPIEELARGQIHVVEETQALPLSSPLLQTLQGEGLRSYVRVPILAQSTLLGSLDLGRANPGSPGPEELDIARQVAAQLALGIQQARLHEQVQRHAVELEQSVARRTAALQASQARLRAIFDGAAIGIALVDAEGCIVESNPALQRMLGYSAAELCEMAFTEFTPPEDVAADVELFRALLAGRRQKNSLDRRYIRKDGQVIRVRLIVSLVRAGGAKVPLAICMVEDITEQKKARQALLNAEKLAIAGQLGASLAHEINNPLQSVIGCLGLAEKNLAEGTDVGRYLRVAREELRRAAGIVAQLRDLHRLSKPEEKEPTNLNALLEQVLLLCKKKCEECRIEVSWSEAGDLPKVLLVSDQMRQVFLNLILNALDATPAGGQLKVSTARTPASEATPAGVCISFSDSGLGIAPDTLPHMFDPFFSTKPQGLGLGLYITHTIVEAHGGRIDVSSRLGEGTTFSVWLPAQTAGEGK